MTKAQQEQIVAAAQQAMGDALQGPRIKADMVVMNTRNDVEVVKGNTGASNGLMHSPAHLELKRIADLRLAKLSKILGKPATEVDRVRACCIKGDKKLHIWPAKENDLDAILVNRVGSSAWINLVELLAPLGLTITTGYWERYAVEFAKEEDPVYPSLVIDLNKPLERKPEPKRKKKEDGKPASEAKKETTTNG